MPATRYLKDARGPRRAPMVGTGYLFKAMICKLCFALMPAKKKTRPRAAPLMLGSQNKTAQTGRQRNPKRHGMNFQVRSDNGLRTP